MSWRLLLLLLVFLPTIVRAQELSSSNYRILWDGFSFGGRETGASENYGIADTVGGEAAGSSTGATYAAQGSFREAEPDWFTFDIYAGSTAVSWSSFSASSAGNAVIVSDASSFSIGDRIVVVENRGFNSKMAMGTVTGIIAGTILQIDRWDGDASLMATTASGGDDFVYLLSQASISFGTVTSTQENVGYAGITVRSTVPTGYFVYMQANQQLKTSTATMTPVSDGAVSTGSEEYGLCGSGSWYAQSGDQSITTQPKVIMSSTQSTGKNYHYLPLNYKLSISSTTVAGSYSQAVYFTLTPRY